MNLLTMKHITKAFTDKALFDGADFNVAEGEKIGIIGINGAGKSTLLKMIAGLEESDEGEIVKGSRVCINYLPQNPQLSLEENVFAYVMQENRARTEQTTLEGEAKSILNRLGFSDYEVPIAQLSGGQKKKAALAAALLSESEILILDEPTNHLDNDMTEWLETYLKEYRGALIMVTHDRYFLDLVCNCITEIDKGKLYRYDTNYEGYLMRKAEREDILAATQKKHTSILRKEIEWMQRGARARSTKQKAHIKRYETLRDEEKIKENGTVEINALSARLGKKTIVLNSVSKAYGDKKLIEDFTYTFLRTDRIGILGANGCGKTTLLKIIIGEVLPDAGCVEIGDTIRIGYYAQENAFADESRRVIDYVKDTAEYIQTAEGARSASQMLETFLFDATLQYAPIAKLSGGEKRRLYLLKVLMEAPNVLILDEPTNDLDIETLCVLEDYLDSFPGILITVSHDRYFLDRVAGRMLTFEQEGRITLFNGSYTEYFLNKEAEDDFPDALLKKGKSEKIKTEKLKFTYQEQKEYETIEQDIEAMEGKLKELEELSVLAACDFVKLSELTREKDAAEKMHEEKMERYLYLSELAEEIKKGCV